VTRLMKMKPLNLLSLLEESILILMRYAINMSFLFLRDIDDANCLPFDFDRSMSMMAMNIQLLSLLGTLRPISTTYAYPIVLSHHS
jgi:hypothetical protein